MLAVAGNLDKSTPTIANGVSDGIPLSVQEEGEHVKHLDPSEPPDEIPLQDQRRILRKIDIRVTARLTMSIRAEQ